MALKVNPRKVALALFSVVMALTFINCMLVFFRFYLEDDKLFGLIEFFGFDIDFNVPTLYSAMTLLICSGLLGLITHANWAKPDGKRLYWLGLTVIFFLLAFDEGTAIHEQTSDVMENYMEAEGVLYFLWVVPYGIMTLVLGLVYLRFLWALPADTRARFVGAGVVFVTGAAGFDMLGGWEADLHGYDTVTYNVLFTLEEFLEMVGIIWFIHALLLHLAALPGGFSLVLGPRDGPSTGADTAL